MASYNVELRKRTGNTYSDIIKVASDWALISNKPATFTPTGHNHDGSNITTGTVPSARLGTGTASSSTFLRGDGVWAAPSDANTWRGIVDNLTSTSAVLSLSANQGKVLKGYIDTLDISNIAGLQNALEGKALATQVLTNVPAGAKFTDTIYSLTKAKIEAVLTGNITTHTHNPAQINTDASNRFVTDTEKTTWNNKVDKVTGKGLSTNDYTTTEKNKLDGIATGATNTAAPYYTSAIGTGDGKLTTKDFTVALKNKLDGIAAGATNTAAPYYTSAIGTGDGKLTTKDFTVALKNKLDGIAAGATANLGTVAEVSAGTTQISGMTMTVANGTTIPTITTSISNAANFRAAIGAGTGTSNLVIGTTASTAKAGNYKPTRVEIETALKGPLTATSIQLGTAATAWSNYTIVLGQSATNSGDYTTALGAYSFANGTNTTALGASASASGESSTALGRSASAAANYTTVIGANAAASGESSTALGYFALAGSSSKLMRLGSAGLSTLQSQISLTVTSDIRDKADIQEVPKALDFIKDLNPITYVRNDRDNYISEEQKETDTYKDYLMVEDYDKDSHSQGTKKGKRRRVGLSAQEVRDKLIEHYGSDNYANVVNDNLVEFEERGLDMPEDLENKLTMSYETMVPFLIKAIQEQQEQIEELKTNINKE